MGDAKVIEVEGHEVRVSNPDKVLFPKRGLTKLDLVSYFLAVAPAALRHSGGRPMALKRYVNGVEGDFFFQKRAPGKLPEFVDTAEIEFPSGRSAREIVLRNAASLAWIANLGCLDLHPHPVRAEDLDHPDELRIDLDPTPEVGWKEVCEVATLVRGMLEEHGLVGFPKTSGSRGIHVNVRLETEWPHAEVRRAALALARDAERRAPGLATARWWKEERVGVFIDYNQNAKDRTVAAAYSVRPVADARVSMPFEWSELFDVDPAALTLETVPALLESKGDPAAAIDERRFRLDSLLELAARQEAAGEPDAPWPPHYARQEGEEKRVSPSRRKRAAKPPQS